MVEEKKNVDVKGEAQEDEDVKVKENNDNEVGEGGDDCEDGDEEAANGEAFPECNVKEEGNEDNKDGITAQDEKENAQSDKAFTIEELLKTKIKFKDDNEGYVYSRGPKYSDDLWPVNCHMCRLGNLVTEEDIKNHAKSRGHYLKCKRKFADAESYHRPFFQCVDKNLGLDKPIKIYPGEIIGEITPELEDRLIKDDDFKVKPPADPNVIKQLKNEPMHEYNAKLPLLGLCYIYKMKGQKGITYFCTLCKIKIKGEAFKHIVGPSHQYKYIERHFPKLYEKVVDRLSRERSVNLKTCVQNIFRKLYRKIENAKGFREITIVDDDDFFTHRRRYLLKTRYDEHYNENTILITEKEVDILIRKCINRMEFIKPDLISLQHPEKGTRSTISRKSPKRSYSDRPYEGRGGYDDPDIWDRYHSIMVREMEDINQQYQEYDRFPKKHPQYFIEERKFLRRAGNDQRKLASLRREWMPFWRRRLRAFYDDEVAKRKFRVKNNLRLRTDVRTPSPNPMDAPRRRVPTRRSPSPSGYNNRRYAGHPDSRNNIMENLPPAPSEPLGVISVLRLLTALEEQLGSLGPKAVQLMSKAVLAEKSNQNPNDLMMENDVYVFFVTAKEKLKGQLFANIVESSKIGAVNRAVQDTSTLLEMFEDYMRRTGNRPRTSAPAAPSNQYESSGNNTSSQYNSGSGQGSQFQSGNMSTSHYPASLSSSNQYQTGSGSGGQFPSTSSNQFSGGSSSGLNQYTTGSSQYSSSGQFTSTSQYRGGSSQGGVWQAGSYSTGSKPGSSFSSSSNFPDSNVGRNTMRTTSGQNMGSGGNRMY